MITEEIKQIKLILDSFLGQPKNDLSDDNNFQLEYPCPRCRDDYGPQEDRKFNLSISLRLQKFNCWKCSSVHDEMHGSIIKLIKLYGNDNVLSEYKNAIKSLRESKLYKLKFSNDDFNIDGQKTENNDVFLPTNFTKFSENDINSKPYYYLKKRGINMDIIKEYNIGYTTYDENNKKVSSRIIIPSSDEFGELNYWTGRDFLSNSKRQKYFNPQIERKNIIFNEDKIQWDADITLVEGPFDHIVVPNSIPLLGKAINIDFKLFRSLLKKANANINIFLDADAYNSVLSIYSLLNHNRLYNRIRYIPVENDLDPSKIYELYGNKGIIHYLRQAKKINEIFLF